MLDKRFQRNLIGWNWDSQNAMIDYKELTHCIFCEQTFKDVYRTKEHIIPKCRIHKNHIQNYTASCVWCNELKDCMDAKQFAKYLELIIRSSLSKYDYIRPHLKTMKDNAWKLYNKTHKSHKNYKILFKNERKIN